VPAPPVVSPSPPFEQATIAAALTTPTARALTSTEVLFTRFLLEDDRQTEGEVGAAKIHAHASFPETTEL
jgi:hypothetical protein